jgi:RsiW-degrading membrane proteinase PrsW (M82 family)
MSNLIRTWLYLVSGLISALIGWNIGQVLLTDFGWKHFPELILFPCVSISLAVGMSATEIFLSNPTRFKLSLRTAKESLKWAIPLGLFSGIISGGICQILYMPAFRIPATMVRIFGWLLIGGFAGLAEGFTWRQRSIEAGNKERADNRLRASVFGGLGASLMAAIIFEFLRKSIGEQ